MSMADARILIVEDDHIIALELKKRLQGLGYEVSAMTTSGENAVALAQDLLPDLVLMDIRLKGTMDGVEAASEIRARFDIPVVFLTAFADEATLQRAKITDPHGYIIKPFEERELHTAIEMALYKHKMEARLVESERWLATILQNIGDAVIATDETGTISLINPVAELLTGWDRQDAVGRNVADVFRVTAGPGYPVIENPVTQALQGEATVAIMDRYLFAKDKRETPIDGSITLIKDEQEKIQGAVFVFRDISARKRQEAEREQFQVQLFQAQEMESIAMVVGGIAHDLNNLMTTVVGYSSVIRSHLGSESPQYTELGLVEKAGRQATSLVEQILALSHQQTAQPRIYDLNARIRDMEDTLQRTIGEDTILTTFLEPEASYIRANPGQIEQILTNLVQNAHEAMPHGGEITVTTETLALDADQCQGTPHLSPGKFARLSVSDTGRGMDDEIVRQIFDPLFSTKQYGPGLGLSVVRNIVEQCEGSIQVHSEPGKGSTFQIYLPVHAENLEHTAEPTIPPPEYQADGRVLLVEDNEGVRTTTMALLQAGGYLVTEAANAREALDIFERENGRFDLLLSDVVLPDQDGLQLADELRSQKPDLAVLLTSGYTDHRAQRPLIHERGLGFVKKPYSFSDLMLGVRATMAGNGHPA
jgi:two-component system cell cycle sensor histidine kinase/response regulator CckA